MARKDFAEIKKSFEDKGYELLSGAEDYKTTSSKLRYKCPKHPDKELFISFHKLFNGKNGCKYCGYENASALRRTSYEIVKKKFEEKGYTLLTPEFKDSKTLLEYICRKHPNKVRKISWSNLHSHDKGCRVCSNEKKAKKRREEMYPIAKATFNSQGLRLLENEYIDAKTPMKFICPNHNKIVQTKTYDDARISGCKLCSYEAIGDMQKLSIENVRQRCLNKGFEFLGTKYENAHENLSFRCLKHNEIVIRNVNNILYSEDKGCKKCGFEKISEKQKEKFQSGLININRENNPNYKGGVTDLNKYLRERDAEWKVKYLLKYDYTCVISGTQGGQLQVHHSILFYKLRDKVLKELKLPLENQVGKYLQHELEAIETKYLEYLNEVEGFPMRKDIHKLFHSIYGKVKNDKNQVEEFKNRYLAGEFNIK